MAKNNKPAAQAAPATTASAVENAEMNIEEKIKAKNSLSSEAFDKAAEEINKERNEIAVNEARLCLGRSEFTEAIALLNLRHARKKEKITKDFLTKVSQLLKETKEGKFTKIEHDKAYNNALNDRSKELEEAKKEFNVAMQEIKRNFRTYDVWSWQMDWEY